MMRQLRGANRRHRAGTRQNANKFAFLSALILSANNHSSFPVPSRVGHLRPFVHTENVPDVKQIEFHDLRPPQKRGWFSKCRTRDD